MFLPAQGMAIKNRIIVKKPSWVKQVGHCLSAIHLNFPEFNMEKTSEELIYLTVHELWHVKQWEEKGTKWMIKHWLLGWFVPGQVNDPIEYRAYKYEYAIGHMTPAEINALFQLPLDQMAVYIDRHPKYRKYIATALPHRWSILKKWTYHVKSEYKKAKGWIRTKNGWERKGDETT